MNDDAVHLIHRGDRNRGQALLLQGSAAHQNAKAIQQAKKKFARSITRRGTS
jgi:hypothetical protein